MSPAGHRRVRLTLLIVTVALLTALPGHALAARSRMSFDLGDDTEAAPDVTVSITLTEFSITPATITVPLGEPVTFVVTNTGGAQHNLEVELESRGIEQRLFQTNLMPGETRRATFTFEAAGEWEMYCPVGNHRALGMEGTIVVAEAQAPTPTPIPTLTPTPTMTLAPTQPATASPTVPAPRTPAMTPLPMPTPTPPRQLAPATGRPSGRDATSTWVAIAFAIAGLGSLGFWQARRRWLRR